MDQHKNGFNVRKLTYNISTSDTLDKESTLMPVSGDNRSTSMFFDGNKFTSIPFRGTRARPEYRGDSQKHRDFVREPMGDKPVTAIAGIGEFYAKTLNEKGFTQASHLLGQFICMGRDIGAFELWLETEIGMNLNHKSDCSACMSEWCDTNL